VVDKVHALEGVVPGLAGVVDGDIVSPVCLVNVDIALRNRVVSIIIFVKYPDRIYLFSHVIPMLGGVDTGSQWSGPGCGVDGSALVLWTRDRLPVNQERDSVFCLWNAIVGCARGYTGGGACHYASGNGLV